MKTLLTIMAALFLFAPGSASAACTGPEGDAGTILYNTDHDVMQYCNDSNWVAMGGGGEAGGVEAGLIAAFDAAECPDGWTEVTDLHDRVIVGAGDTYNVGDTGGAATVALTAAQLAAHTHSVDPPNTSTNTTGNHTHSTIATGVIKYYSGVEFTNYPGYGSGSTGAAGNHSHTVDIAAFNSGSAGSGSAHENRPPYRAYTMCKYDDGSAPSLREYKEQIADLSIGLDTLMDLRPVEYVWTEERGGYPDTGFIAEEVAAVSPVLADYNATGALTGVKYDHLTALLTRAVQELKAENDELRENVDAILKRLDAEDGE
ncbi:MAG: tail fiber domain-containing protein [Rhizobiaceae bacterium]